MPKMKEEHRRYISKLHGEKKNQSEILRAFGDKYGFIPSTTTLNKYLNYNEEHPPKKIPVVDEDEEGGEEGGISAKTKDTRLDKGLYDFSDGEIDKETFGRLARNINKSEEETWNLLAEAKRRGYKKVNIATGEVE